MEWLRDDVSWNDSTSLRLLAKLLACVGLREEAAIAYSAGFSKLDDDTEAEGDSYEESAAKSRQQKRSQSMMPQLRKRIKTRMVQTERILPPKTLRRRQLLMETSQRIMKISLKILQALTATRLLSLPKKIPKVPIG
jgi:hypothetical protein